MRELKTSYRNWRCSYHPDRNRIIPRAEEQFKACSERIRADDPEKRAAYDGSAMRRSRTRGAAGNPFQGAGFQGDLGDIFGHLRRDVRGGGRRASRVQRGRDLRYDLTLEFEEAVAGVEKEIIIRRLDRAKTARTAARTQGSGNVYAVRGRGQVRFQQGFFSVGEDVLALRRHGFDNHRAVPDAAARACSRSGTPSWLKVPAGVEQDTRIRYQGEARPAVSRPAAICT